MPRIILHVDLDAFFAAVEERENSKLKGKPLVIGADPIGGKGRGVVSTCNYSARKYGIRSGMPISIAWRKCPEPTCIYLPVNMDLYEKVSGKIYEIFRKYADLLEPGGIDEAYLDVSQRAKDYKEAIQIGKKIKEEILEKEKLTCSIGIAPNKLVAKIASDFQKPDGLTVVKLDQVKKFLGPLSVRKIIGVGPKTEARLNQMNIFSVRDLRKLSKAKLQDMFGKFGNELYDFARGADESPVVEGWAIKSVGREYTFPKDTKDKNLIMKILADLAEETHKDLKQQKLKFRTVVLKIRFEHFETHTKQASLKEPTDSLLIIKSYARDLIKPFLEENKKVRLIGVRVTKFST